MQGIPYGKQSITNDDIEAVIQTLQSDFLTQGPKVSEFEEAFAQYIGCKYAIAVSSGTAALHLCALALDVQNGDRWITSPITFSATANCIRYCGGEICFVDIDPETGLFDLDKLEELLENNSPGYFKGILGIDFAGLPMNMERLKNIASQYHLRVIEDSCHAPGGFFINSKSEKVYCGSGIYSDLAIFSFHPVKHVACGEGGMVTTNDPELAERVRRLRTHGIEKNPELLDDTRGWVYEMIELGYNYRLSDIHASLGLSQLARAKKNFIRRREIAAKYDKSFHANSQITPLALNHRDGHAFHLYVILSEFRDELYSHLRSKQIYTQVHYIPIYKLKYYKDSVGSEQLVHSENYYNQCLSIPLYPSIEENQIEYVIECINEYSKK